MCGKASESFWQIATVTPHAEPCLPCASASVETLSQPTIPKWRLERSECLGLNPLTRLVNSRSCEFILGFGGLGIWVRLTGLKSRIQACKGVGFL